MASSLETFPALLKSFSSLGVQRILVKELALNDNSKNQVYVGRGFESLNLIPVKSIEPKEPRRKNEKKRNFKAPLNWSWLSGDKIVPAPRTQLILYPAYPEVRISGFLDGCDVDDGITRLMTGRISGRVLFLGIASSSEIYAAVAGRTSRIFNGWNALKNRATNWSLVWRNAVEWHLQGIALTRGRAGFMEFQLVNGNMECGCIREVLERLQTVHRQGWHRASRLKSSKELVPSRGQNAGGNTLESLFGIVSNPSKEPDFKGWELKNVDVQSDRVTLVTPEPQGGLYKEKGVIAFVERFGYADDEERNRRNFASTHIHGVTNAKTRLTLSMDGYSYRKKKITDNEGGIVLKTPRGAVAAKWYFQDLMYSWNRKHSSVVFVPSSSKTVNGRQYNYLQEVAVAEGSDFLKFLKSLSEKQVFFDPGTNIVFTGKRAKAHARSQFRVKMSELNSLYGKFRWLNICNPIRVISKRTPS